MAKRNVHQKSEQTKGSAPLSPQAAATVAQVVAKTEPAAQNMSVDSLIAALSDPKVRENARNQLNDRINARQRELEQLIQARDTLIAPTTPPAPATESAAPTPARRGRPPATDSNGTDHTSAILTALQGEKNGLNAADLGAKLQKQGHPIDSKILASYVWKMSNDGKLKKSGTRGNFIYKTA